MGVIFSGLLPCLAGIRNNTSALRINHSNIISLLIYCAIFGFAGSFISLFLSKPMAKSSYRITPITRQNTTGKALALYEMIEQMAAYKHIKMPEVGIYPSPDNNALPREPLVIIL